MIIAIVSVIIISVLTSAIIAFLLCGVRLKAYFDLETGTFVADIFFFRNYHAIKYKAFECNGNFYSQVNSRELKKININDKKEHDLNAESTTDDKNTDKDKKIGYFQRISEKMTVLSEWIDSSHKLKFKTIRAYLTVGTGNSMATSITVSAIAAVMGAAQLMIGDKIKAKTSDICVYPNFRYENTVLTLDIDTGAGLTGILLSILSLIVKNKKLNKKAVTEKTATK